MQELSITGVKIEAEDGVNRYSFCIERCSFNDSGEPGVRIWKDGNFIDLPEDVFNEMVKALHLLPDFDEYVNSGKWLGGNLTVGTTQTIKRQPGI